MIDALFVGAVVLLWAAVLHNTVLLLAARSFVLGRRRRAGGDAGDGVGGDGWLPGVSVLVPAHDEARVIDRSIRAYLALDYPVDRLGVVVVDDASADGTGDVCDRVAAEDPRVRVVHVPRGEGGRGKAAALNAGLSHCRFPLLAVYDADNRPRPDALRRLVEAVRDPVHDGAVGSIVKANRRRTLLNRFTSIEFAAFQWMIQAGRARLFDLVLLPGTNFVVRRDAVAELGGWDPDALTEDLDLSVRLYAARRRIAFVPEAVSDEQDPERLRPWFHQRLRWTVGNLYVVRKHLGALLRRPRWRTTGEVLSLVYFQVLFLSALIASDALFVAGLVGAVHLRVPGPYVALWFLAFALFVASIQLTQALEGEDDWRTPFVAGLMYLTYAQLWIFLALRGLVTFLVTGGIASWTKTPRFAD